MNTFNLRGAFALNAVAAFGLLCGNTSPVFAEAAQRTQQPTGSWLYTVTIPVDDTPANNIIFQGVETYIPGGGYIETDQLSFAAAGLSTPSHGSWAMANTSAPSFLLTYLNFSYDNTGTQQGMGRVRQLATLSADGQSYTGGGDFVYYDPKGKAVLAGTFTVTATRIQVQAPSQVANDPSFPQNLKAYGRLRRLLPQ